MATVNYRTDIKKDSEDNIYYNVRIFNPYDGADVITASYSENRTVPVLENPSDYELAVLRFKVPAEVIPIFLWKDPSPYYITLNFDGYDSVQQLQFIPDAPPNDDKFLYGPAIWSYQSFVDILNKALSDGYADVKANRPLAPPTEAPFFTYDAKTELITLNAEQLYDSEGVPTISIWANYDLFALIPSFQVKSFPVPPVNPLKFQRFRIKNNGFNTITYNGNPYYQMEQEYITLALLNDFVSIVFESDSIPVNSELLPAQKNDTRRIITDFEPLDGVNDHQAYQFYPQGPLRYYDLKSNFPLNRIDMKVYWTDREGREFPIYINRGDLLTLKIMFRKKVRKQIESVFFKQDEEEI